MLDLWSAKCQGGKRFLRVTLYNLGVKRRRREENREDCTMGSFSISTSYQYHSGYQIESKMGGACSRYEGQKRCLQGVGGET